MRRENPVGYHIIMAFIYQAAMYDSVIYCSVIYQLTGRADSGAQPTGSGARGQHPLTQGGQANPNVAVMQAGTTLQLASRAV